MWPTSPRSNARVACDAITKKPLLSIVTAIVVWSCNATPAAQRAPSTLSNATEMQCAFSQYATGNWKDDQAVAQVQTSNRSVAFKDIDIQDGFATAVGTFGPSTIVVRLASGSLHLMQTFTSGALYVTTVFDKAVRGGRLKAVHTRHEYTDVSLPGFTSRPEQYYGDCEVTQKQAAASMK